MLIRYTKEYTIKLDDEFLKEMKNNPDKYYYSDINDKDLFEEFLDSIIYDDNTCFCKNIINENDYNELKEKYNKL